MGQNEIKAVLFDAGNTLIQCNPSMSDVVARSLEGEGMELSAAQHAQMDGLLWKYYAHYQEKRGLKTSIEESVEFWRLVYHDIARDLALGDPARCAAILLEAFAAPEAWRPFEDVRPTLEALAAQGVRMGVISNWTANLPRILAGNGLTPYFEFVVTSAEVGYEKPELAIYDAALRGRHLRPQECLYVGDSLDNDYLSSITFGMEFALIDRADKHRHMSCRRLQDMRQLTSLWGTELVG